MNGATIITKFTNMVDDVLDSDFAYQLLNDAKDEIEGMRTWVQLHRDQQYTVASGYAYTSALGTLPTRFALPITMIQEDGTLPYHKIDFTDFAQKKNNPTGYFLDLGNGNVHLSGSSHSAKTMHFFHTVYSADITSSTSWTFPDRFHQIIPLKMAELYYPSDAGERGRSWDDKWATQYRTIMQRMELWDDQLNMTGRRASQQIIYTPKSIPLR